MLPFGSGAWNCFIISACRAASFILLVTLSGSRSRDFAISRMTYWNFANGASAGLLAILQELHKPLATHFVFHQAFCATCFDFKIAFDIRVKVKLHVEAEEAFTKRTQKIVVYVLDNSLDATSCSTHQHGDTRSRTAYTSYACLSVRKGREDLCFHQQVHVPYQTASCSQTTHSGTWCQR